MIPLEWSRQALAESESRYRTLVELSPDAICVHEQGCILFVNPAARVLFGCLPHHGLVGRNIAEWIDPADRQGLVSALQGSEAREPRHALAEGRLIQPDGTRVAFELMAMPIAYDGKGAVQCVLRDITALQ